MQINSLRLMIGKLFFVCSAVLIWLLIAVNLGRAEELRLGLQSFLSYAPVFIALERGYFKDQGLAVKTTMIRGGGTAAFNALISGQLDITGGAITASLLNSVIRGANLRVIADKGQNRKDYSVNELWITRSLYEQGVKTPQGLKGKTVATAASGTSDWVILGLLAQKYGISLPKKEIKAVVLPGPERSKALESGSVDGAVLVEPFIARVDKSKAVRLAGIVDVMPVFQTAVLYTNGDYFNKHRPDIRKFISGLKRATSDYLKNPKSDALLRIFAKYTHVKPETIKAATPVYFDPETKIAPEAVKEVIDFLYRSGLIDRRVSLEEFVAKNAM